MYQLIKSFAENSSDHGLLLIDMPTGSGKTYQASKYIYDACMKPENKDRKFIYVTTLKKNLPDKTLKELFDQSGHTQLFHDKVLFLDSNLECAIKGWSPDMEYQIPNEIKNTDEYKAFSNSIKYIKAQRALKHTHSDGLLFSIEGNFRENAEPQFRKRLTMILEKRFKTVTQRIHVISTDPAWQWVGKLYPAVFTQNKQIILMSMSKFLGRNSTVVEPSYLISSSNLIKNALIIIDEFDATKATMMKGIIENGLHDNINYIELFTDIYAALRTDDFPTKLTTPSKEQQRGKYRNRDLQMIITNLNDVADKLYTTYTLQFKHKTSDATDDHSQNYMFQDYQYHFILNADKAYIILNSDKKQRINSISFTKTKPAGYKNQMQALLGQIRGFLSYFQVAVKILAINYMQCKMEQHKDGEDAFTMESSVRTVLSLFRLNKEQSDYLTSQIMMTSHKSNEKYNANAFDLSVYERGFRYYSFENHTEHDMQSQIMMYSFNTTPEKILLHYCEKTKVVVISATATIPTVIGNYDLHYLKQQLQDAYIEPTEEDKKRMKTAFELSQSGYQNIQIHAELLGNTDVYSKTSWQTVFQNHELAASYYEKLQRQFDCNERSSNYLKLRYLRIALAFQKFVEHSDIRSFLCMLNKLPQKGDSVLDQTMLFSIFKDIAYEYGWTTFSDQNIMYLSGKDYDDQKDTLLNRLSKGEKIFVISAYQTIGAGQNLQYAVPAALKQKLIRTNNLRSGTEKDFDAIYLDKPTYLVVPLSRNMEEEAFVKYLFQMEFLQESAELSPNDTVQNIKVAFKHFMNTSKKSDRPADIYHKPSVILLNTRHMIQAIGRICRTNQKNPNIYIYADANIADCIDPSVAKGRILNPEFRELLRLLQKTKFDDSADSRNINQANLRAQRVNKELQNVLGHAWSESTMRYWGELRELVLRHPTASNELARSNGIIQNFFLELPEESDHYYYAQQDDYSSVSVSFTRNKEHPLLVSAEGTKLYEMLQIPGVRQLFEANGYATDFQVNSFIMTPPLWNNIYKGALGEVVGKYLFETLLSVSVSDIKEPELFELFDYAIEGSSVYVDFKNWHEGKTTDRTEMLHKIAEKAKICGCQCVIVANILAENDYPVSDTTVDGIRILTVPKLVKHTANNMTYDTDAWKHIRECVNEYRN